MCFEGQLGSPFDVVVAGAWALIDRDPVAQMDFLAPKADTAKRRLKGIRQTA